MYWLMSFSIGSFFVQMDMDPGQLEQQQPFFRQVPGGHVQIFASETEANIIFSAIVKDVGTDFIDSISSMVGPDSVASCCPNWSDVWTDRSKKKQEKHLNKCCCLNYRQLTMIIVILIHMRITKRVDKSSSCFIILHYFVYVTFLVTRNWTAAAEVIWWTHTVCAVHPLQVMSI